MFTFMFIFIVCSNSAYVDVYVQAHVDVHVHVHVTNKVLPAPKIHFSWHFLHTYIFLTLDWKPSVFLFNSFDSSLVDGYFVLMSKCAEGLTQQAVQTSRCAVRPTVYWPLVAPLARRRGHVVTQWYKDDSDERREKCPDIAHWAPCNFLKCLFLM